MGALGRSGVFTATGREVVADLFAKGLVEPGRGLVAGFESENGVRAGGFGAASCVRRSANDRKLPVLDVED